mmetsp:Transcript_17003/g.42577  ORF Transcript_17003/g.42577 Transcript_17003/m.42577 type:complete len:215 (+) Transcript_17003:650-1294(+)
MVRWSWTLVWMLALPTSSQAQQGSPCQASRWTGGRRAVLQALVLPRIWKPLRWACWQQLACRAVAVMTAVAMIIKTRAAWQSWSGSKWRSRCPRATHEWRLISVVQLLLRGVSQSGSAGTTQAGSAVGLSRHNGVQACRRGTRAAQPGGGHEAFRDSGIQVQWQHRHHAAQLSSRLHARHVQGWQGLAGGMGLSWIQPHRQCQACWAGTLWAWA